MLLLLLLLLLLLKRSGSVLVDSAGRSGHTVRAAISVKIEDFVDLRKFWLGWARQG